MKKLFYLVLSICFLSTTLFAQILPDKMFVLTPDGVQVTSQDNENRAKTEKPMIRVGDKLFFTAQNTASGEELWVSELTPESTKMVKDINPGAEGSNPKWLTAVGNKVYFVASTASAGEELWVSDGTSEGTKMVKDIYPGSTGSEPIALTALKDKLLFFAMDEESEFDPVIDPSKAERWLWMSDGTEAGTVQIGRTPTKETNYDGMSGFIVPCGDIAFFIGYDIVNNETLWKTDGTKAGTVVVKNINPRTSSGSFQTEPGSMDWITNVDDKWVVFRAETVKEVTGTIDVGNEIWMSDGTETGTKWIGIDFAKGETNGTPSPAQFAVARAFGDTLLFRANDGIHGVEPCIFVLSEPIVEGVNPRMIVDINHWGNNPALHSWGTLFHIYQGDIYLQANGGYFLPNSDNPTQERGSGYSLWRIPLTLDTCYYQTQIWDTEIYAGNNRDNCKWFTTVNDKLFFSAEDAPNNFELWMIEDRNTAPKKLVDLPDNGKPCHLTDINDNLYFVSEGTKQLYAYQMKDLTGIREIKTGDRVNVYPTPATDWISVTSEKPIKQVIIFDVLGNTVRNQPYKEQISVSGLLKGVYILNVIFEDNTNAVVKFSVK